VTSRAVIPRREQRAEMLTLLNGVLRPNHAPTIELEYPLAFARANDRNARVVVEDDRIVSHALFVPMDYRVGETSLRVGVIGSVATRSTARRRGHSTTCLEACEQGIADAGGCLAVLWADGQGFYERRGYVRAGREDLFIIPTSLLRQRHDRSDIRPFADGDEDGIAALHGQLRCRTFRSRDEWARLLRIPDMRTMVSERDGEIVAYACCGKGADFAGVVHEWAGPADAVFDLVLEQARAQGREEIVLLSPPGQGRLRRPLRERGVPAHEGALGMMRIVHAERFARSVDRYLERTPESGHRVFAESDDRFIFRGPSGDRAVNASEMIEISLGAETAASPEIPGLPMPFYLRGLDSV